MSAPEPSSNKPVGKPSAAHAIMSKSPDEAVALDDSEAAKASRKPAVEADEEKAVQLGIRPPIRPTNLRRSSLALQLFGLMFVVILVLFGALLAGLYNFYEKKIQPHLGSAQTTAAPAVPAALKIDVPEETRNELAAATAKVTELQKQIDALRDASSTTEGRLREIADRVAAAATAAAQSPPKPIDVAPTPATDASPTPEVAAMTPVSTPTNRELVLLKERNRLTAWADEAIATGNRKSLDMLIKRLTDADHANLRDATFAEIQRIYYHLRFTIRIDPGFRIPVNEVFKDTGIRDEADIKTEQLIKLLHDQQQAWQVRLRAAWLMGGRRTPEVTEALIKAIKEDTVLDVAKEAQLSLEQNVDRKFLLLDIPAIDEWWKSQSAPQSDLPTKTEPEKTVPQEKAPEKTEPEKKAPAPEKPATSGKSAKKKSSK